MGGITVRTLVVSTFALDGGAMHGIVPRPLWERVHAADDRNRIALCARVVLVDDARSGARTLVELGMGQRWSEKERRIYGLAPGGDVPEVLRAAGVDPDTVTHVVLTHLHWDHAGGLVLAGPDFPALAFPRAEHVVGAASLDHAARPTEKDSGSFRPDDVALLLRDAKVRRWRPGEPLAPGLTARLSNGHTAGLVVPIVRARDDGPPVAIPTDLVPTRSHLKPNWVMAYDEMPSVAVAEKRALFEDLAAMGGGVVLYHDPVVDAAWAVAGPNGPEMVRGRIDGWRVGAE